jgi:prepilin-type N-terminal cleavage/methylation domain-containing protein
MKSRKNGFTLIEIMIVVLIFGILLVIAVPNFVRARASSRLQAIVSNLRVIDRCVEEWGMSQNQASGAVVLQSDLDGTGGGAAYILWPKGPIPGTYAVTSFGTLSTFNGGSLGPMDAGTWRATCDMDPAVCGL